MEKAQGNLLINASADSNQWPSTAPSVGQSHRVSGDSVPAIIENSHWKSGVLDIDTPLPTSYPPPTPGDCIEVKTYPIERRAEYDS